MSSETRPPDRIDDEEASVAAAGIITPSESSSSEVSEANSTQPLTGRRSTDADHTNNGTSTARWSVKSVAGNIWRWIKGPIPPQELRISPLFPNVQAAPLRLLNIICPKRKHKLAAYFAFISVWMTVFVVVTHYSYFETQTDALYGTTAHLACSNALWYRNNGCGVDGLECQPFKHEEIPFRCPSQCLRAGRVLNYRAVGDHELIYQPFVVGGPPTEAALPNGGKYNATYRADSFICDAALHAGVISNRYGGCGLLKMTGEKSKFVGSNRNGIPSAGFDANFPASFTFVPVKSSHCMDLRWHLLPITVFFTVIAVLFISRPLLLFFTLFPAMFFHVALSSDPPGLMDPNELVSLALGRFLPDTFIAYVLGKYVVSNSINFSGQFEKVILWLGGFWVGALNNLTFDPLIPLQRLTPRDLAQEPGAKAALAIVIIVLVTIAISQIYFIRLTGKLPKYLVLYIGFGITLGLLIAIPGQALRIHHYILSLLLLPGTGFQTRPSLLYQGILLGMHINGVARWGFASIIETPAALLGDGALFSHLPRFEPNPIVQDQNVTIFWNGTLQGYGGWPYPWEGVSILVNDVERHRSSDLVGNFTFPRFPVTNETLVVRSDDFVMPTDIDKVLFNQRQGGATEFGVEVLETSRTALARRQDAFVEEGQVMQPLYLRIAYTRGAGSRITSGDYTRGGVVLPVGTWVPPGRGRT